MKRFLLATAVTAGFICACVSQSPQPLHDKQQKPSDFSEKFYLDASERGRPIFRIDPALSLAVIEVRRGGSLARLGHDHVVASHDIQGFLAPEEGRSDVYVQLDRLVVDEPELRAESGFDTQPSAAFIAATRQNMLDKVLEVEQYRFARISVRTADSEIGESRLNVSMTLHGSTRTLQVPVMIEKNGDEIAVSGRLMFNQTDFGMAPFSILGGAITVQDPVYVRFHIRARRMMSANLSEAKE
jgi:YceI-like protein